MLVQFILYFLFIYFSDCESLIRKMLVLDPLKRYTIEQIRRHRWMAGVGVVSSNITNASVTGDTPRSPARGLDPNEQVLRLMQSLGIDPAKTKEVHLRYIRLLKKYKCT